MRAVRTRGTAATMVAGRAARRGSPWRRGRTYLANLARSDQRQPRGAVDPGQQSVKVGWESGIDAVPWDGWRVGGEMLAAANWPPAHHIPPTCAQQILPSCPLVGGGGEVDEILFTTKREIKLLQGGICNKAKYATQKNA